MSRRRGCLFLTESEGYDVQAQQQKLPSRFIAEIKRDLFVTEGAMDEAPWRRLQEQIANENLDETSDSPEDVDRADSITAGDTVFHKIFGQGEVLEITDTGSCKVRFADGKIRFLRSTFLSRLAPDA